jgi:hypothetical protein
MRDALKLFLEYMEYKQEVLSNSGTYEYPLGAVPMGFEEFMILTHWDERIRRADGL